MALRELGAFDVVIVGAGTAGCLLANRLSADPDRTVALIEAGGSDDYLWIHVPVGYLYCIGNPRTDWCFATAQEPGLNGRSIRYPRGRVLGGCSSINGMIYMRGQREDYDGWREGDGFGVNPGWGWDDVLPLFRQHEDYHGGVGAHHGAGGEWRVEKARVRWEILDAFRAAAASRGIPPTDDFNCGGNFGCGYFDVNQTAGVRLNTSGAFLRRIRRRRNLALFTGTQALRLALDGLRCTGVEVRRASGDGLIRARGETLLAAGAIGSPQLLQLSGIGASELLEGRGIALRHPLPGVGRNLQDHLQLRMVFGVSGVKTLNTMAASWIGKGLMALRYGLTRSGPLAMSPSQLGAFAYSRAGMSRPDLEYHVQPLSLDRFGEPLHPFNAFTASVCNLRPTSRGSVTIASPDPRAAPVIAPAYLDTDADRQVAVDALRLTREIVAAQPLARYRPQELRPGPELRGDEELVRAAGEIGTTIFHPVGTAKMGPTADAAAVVDAELRVHGIGALRVIDASIMPMITSGNTCAPTLMIAEQGARLVASALRRAS